MAKHLERFKIAVDANEYHHGNTWIFPSHSIRVKPLVKYGVDYAVLGQEGIIGVERKAYSDYVRCVGKGWDAFAKQLDKLRKNKYACVVVEANMDDPIYYKSRMIHEAVILKTAQIISSGMPVVFAGSRTKAALFATYFFKESLIKLQDS